MGENGLTPNKTRKRAARIAHKVPEKELPRELKEMVKRTHSLYTSVCEPLSDW